MLAEMRIQGLGVIDEATLELHPGLTVVTGETGAGKTMVVTGLHLLSGGRAESSRVRSGAERTVVEGRFRIEGTDGAAKVAADVGADPDEDGSLIAVRTVNADGRSRAHLGGRSVPIGVLAQLAEQALAVHGQNDQLRLLRGSEQRAVLDRFAGEPVLSPLADYRRVRAEWLSVAEEYRLRTEQAKEMAREAGILRHGLTEIEALDPQPGEDEELVEEAKRLADADQLRAAAFGAQLALTGAADGDPDQPGALGMLGDARRRLIGADDNQLRDLEPRLGEAIALLVDVGGELGAYLDRLDADPARLERVLSRQAELKALTRKYAADIDGVLAWAQDARQRLSLADGSDGTLDALAKRRDELEEELVGHAERVGAARVAASNELGKAVSAELAGLAMSSARIEVAVLRKRAVPTDDAVLTMDGQRVQAGPDGVDDVELRLIAHEGAPALPVQKGASGGELSRVMLALEVVLADSDPVPTMVFDEVDAGVGGRAAVEVGRRLARLAVSHQVVVVTHLPQVAAYADRHLVVHKGSGSGITASSVRTVSEADRVVELARMLAGMDSTETGRAHAEELLSVAERDRGSFGSGKRSTHPGGTA